MSSDMIKSFGKLCDGEIDIVLLAKDDLEGALGVIRNSFILNENCCIAAEINRPENAKAQEDLLELCRQVFAIGVSLVAKHVETGKVVAVSFNMIHVASSPTEEPFFSYFMKQNCRTPNSRLLVNVMKTIDASFDFFQKFDIDCFLEIMFLATLPQFEGRKIGQALCHQSIHLASALNQGITILSKDLQAKRVEAVTAIMTAWGSQRIGIAIGMETVMEVPFEQFSFDGKTFSERLGSSSPPTMKLMAIKF